MNRYHQLCPHFLDGFLKEAFLHLFFGFCKACHAQEYGDKNVVNPVVMKHALVINPLNWKRDDTYAPSSENLGDRIPVFTGQGMTANDFRIHRPGLADARLGVERGVVVCTTMSDYYSMPPVPGLEHPFGPGGLHVFDYPAFWVIHNAHRDRRKGAVIKTAPCFYLLR